jgi:hypothetical protein
LRLIDTGLASMPHNIVTADSTIREHLVRHVGDVLFGCTLCTTERFFTLQEAGKHTKAANGMEYRCPLCRKLFPTSYHQRRHADKCIKCSQCGKCCTGEKQFRVHLRLDHSETCPAQGAPGSVQSASGSILMPESETVNQTRYNGNYAAPTRTPKSAMALFDELLSTSYFPTDEISSYPTQIVSDNTVREYAGYAFPML